MIEPMRFLVSKAIGFRGKTSSALQTLLFPLWARVWGIQVGCGVRIQGWPILFRVEGSRVQLGRRTTLLSSPRSNFIGVNRPCYIAAMTPETYIQIGDDCGFTGTVISGHLSITLGNGVMCGANTTITDSDWHHTDPARRMDTLGLPCAPVVIEDNVWLGLGCTVLKGVRIGRDTVVAAGSIVTTDLPAGVIASGIPARARRMISGPITGSPGEAP